MSKIIATGKALSLSTRKHVGLNSIYVKVAYTSEFYKECKYKIRQQDYESYVKSSPSVACCMVDF